MKTDTLICILFDLLADGRITAREEAEKYDISLRTAFRYMDALTVANVPIYAERGKGGGFGLLGTHKLPAGFLTEGEFNAVTEALSAVNSQLGSAQLQSALQKLKATRKGAPNLTLSSGNLIIDAGHWGDTGSYKQKLAAAEKSIEEQRVLTLKYHDRTGVFSERDVEPHALLFKQGLWYLYAFCRLREDFRLFKLGRIKQMGETGETFSRRPLPQELPLWQWFSAENSVNVKFEIKKSALSDFEEWVGIEHIRPSGKHFAAEVRLPDDGGLISKILAFGTGIKVIAPESLKKRIAAAAREVAALYTSESKKL